MVLIALLLLDSTQWVCKEQNTQQLPSVEEISFSMGSLENI